VLPSAAIRATPRHRTSPPAPARRPELTALLASAAQADEGAWDCLVHRFGATIDRIARRHGLAGAAADDVAQLTWLALLEHIYAVRDAEALGGWIATTARRACLQVQQGATREVLVDEPREVADRTTVEKQVEAAEREVVLRHAMEVLNPRERRLVELLLADPEVSYRQIGAALEMPIGSIGPTRQRCFGRLRRVPQLAALAQAA
jgi:RNA polymerase sigma factor (sigma-70 family)